MMSSALGGGLTKKSSLRKETEDNDGGPVLDKSPEKKGNILKNRAGESRSPYVRAHKNNPVAWQIWGEESIEFAKKENKLLFLSIGYNSCHWCHVMERESFENDEVAQILNTEFIPIKIDREERPDIDRIYMNFVQALTGSGGWPLNVFVTPTLEPVFGGTYWPGPNSNASQSELEEQGDFLGILNKLSEVWRDQEDRCRQDSAQILQQLKDFAAEGTVAGGLGDGGDGLDLELLEEGYQHLANTFDTKNGGFGAAPKFPTPPKLSFLLRLSRFPRPVIDVVGTTECARAKAMAITTLRKMARGGIHDQIGHGFARYSVTPDWSLPHFEKMLYDNAQLLHLYLDAFLTTSEPEFLGVVYDIVAYLTDDALASSGGGFYSSEDADSFSRKGDTEKHEGAFYVWGFRELESLLKPPAVEVCAAFWGVSPHGNVAPENDAHDEFISQNVLSVVKSPTELAKEFGMPEDEIVKIIKESRQILLAHRNKERTRPDLDDKIVVGWNGIAIGALARTSAALKTFDLDASKKILASAVNAARFIKSNMWDGNELKRVWREEVGETPGFADDYANLIEGLIELFEVSGDEEWLKWADELQVTQISLFYDNSPTSGGFFATKSSAAYTILRLKDGMDSSEPSTNGTSASNLYRLSSLLSDDSYAQKAKQALEAFEAEIMQYPWLFGSFMPGVVASRLGVKNKTVLESSPPSSSTESRKLAPPRGGLSTIAKISAEGSSWLRSRNHLLTDITFPKDGRKVMICENGTCREEVNGTSKGKDKQPSGYDIANTEVPPEEAAALGAAQGETVEEAVQKAAEAVGEPDVEVEIKGEAVDDS